MKNRTQEEIQFQIEGLKKEKENVPELSMFGDKNHEKIDAQIAVLQDEKEADDFYIDESSDEFEDADNDIYFAAKEAEDWLDGITNENLFSE